MPNQVLSSVENNFTKGLVTEFTGLNFPENAATDTNNAKYSIVGDVTRRLGIDLELNGLAQVLDRTGKAVTDYKWDNAGGDGLTQLVVRQLGHALYFYQSSLATAAVPLSARILVSLIDLAAFTAPGVVFDSTLEAQFATGNGYLFVYHPSCSPFYVTYSSGTLTGNAINMQVRDFIGVLDNLPVSTRPSTLSAEHQYNLTNQGWVQGNAWDVNSGSANTISVGAKAFFIGGGVVGITLGQQIRVLYETGGNCRAPFDYPVMSGTVTSYGGGSLGVNITTVDAGFTGQTGSGWRIQPVSVAYMNSWFTAVGNFPSNSDVWWYFKNTSGVFDPATTNQNVTISTGNAPRGHFLLDPFNQQRTTVSGVGGMTTVSTSKRPRTGAWFQGRVWFAGTDATQIASGNSSQYSWSESIYFSQTISTPSQFGNCYQQNDPTSQNLFDILPTDGGVIVIQGCGSVYKLFPITNGMLVFAANGVWFITGSRGIGFAANDYTITKLSAVRSLSSTSFVDVNGLPYFWNEEGIYAVEPTQNGGLQVNPLTIGTILSFFENIPTTSKQYARGAYDPINYNIQWVYRDTEAADVTGIYSFNKILNYNTYNKAFYPYTVDNTAASINGVIYVTYPGGTTSAQPGFKYQCSKNSGLLAYADEHDLSYKDWVLYSVSSNYVSYFVTGYKLHGQGQRRFQIPYIYMYSNNTQPTNYKIQGLWDYAISGNSGRWSTAQLTNNFNPRFGLIIRRHRIRGQGLILQIKVSSVDGKPFDIIGWSTFEQQNMSV